jgi:hypothetical protein
MATDYAPIFFTSSDGTASRFDLTTNLGFTNVRRWVPVLVDGSANFVTGFVHVPGNFASAAKIKCRFAANATTGAFGVRASTSSQTDGESADASWVDESYQSITTPGTGKLMKEVTFPSAGSLSPTVAVGDTLQVKITRDGAGASVTDSLAVDLMIIDAWLEYTS